MLKVNGVNDGAVLTAQEMEAFKVEIIKEVRKEFQKMKQEIVEGNNVRQLKCNQVSKASTLLTDVFARF